MNKFLIIFILAIVSCDTEMDKFMFDQFQKFMTKYHKKYESMNEFLLRFETFRRNFHLLGDSNGSFTTGITKFSDMTQSEFSKNFLTLDFNPSDTANFETVTIKEFGAAPPSYDWRNEGRVSPIKNQGNKCSCCYAFSTIANLESLYYAKTKVMTPLSEQMIIDCDPEHGGCSGGLMQYSLDWIKKNGGIMAEKDYLFSGIKGPCKKKEEKYVDLKVTGYKKLGEPDKVWNCVDENQIKEFLYANGPLIAAINGDFLKSYTGGIIDPPKRKCTAGGIDKAVLIIGYGNEGSTNMDYWIVKNSWGKDWGESGYFRIRRGTGACGINCYIMTATVE